MNRSYLLRGQVLVLTAIPLVLVVVTTLAQANPLTTMMDHDSGIFAYVGSQALQGKPPYLAAWDSKPPGVFFIDAAGLWLGGGTRRGIWLVEFLFLLAAAALGFCVINWEFGFAPAIAGSAAWLIVLQSVLGGGNYTEEFSLLFSFASLLLFFLILRRPASWPLHLALGLIFGSNFLLRPNNTGVQVAILAAEMPWIFRQQPTRNALRNLIAVTIGFLIPIMVVTAYFAVLGAVRPYLEGAFLYNISYLQNSQAGQNSASFDLAGALRAGMDYLGGRIVLVALLGVAVAGKNLWLQVRAHATSPVTVWLCLDPIVELFMTSVSGRNYVHYFILWLPWIALACALLFSTLMPELSQYIAGSPVPVLLIVTALILALSWNALKAYGVYSQSAAVITDDAKIQNAVVELLKSRTRPDESVLVLGGDVGFNFLANRHAPTQYITYGGFVPSPYTESMAREFYEDVVSRPPVVILSNDTSRAFPPLYIKHPVAWTQTRNIYVQPYVDDLFQFVHNNYHYETTIGNWLVYALGP
jgi:hypothetical protein